MSFLGEFYAQNSLLLMNGKKLTIGNFEIVKEDEEKIIQYYNEKGKFKQFEIVDVFSLTDNIGGETIFNTNDSINGIVMNEIQLRKFIQGESDAIINYQDNFSFISSYAVGFISIFYPPFSKIFFFPVYPSTYVSILGLSSPEYEQIVTNTSAEINDIYYILGYKEAAKLKRIKNGLLGAGAGILTGVAVAILIGY